jgi:hypothetical protein
VRAAFAHAPWSPGIKLVLDRPTPLFSWLHDPDVAWLIGLHEHEGLRYFNKELSERLLWWMALRAMLAIAADPKPDREAVRDLEHQLERRMRAAAKAGYSVEALFDSGRAEVKPPAAKT